MKRVKKATPTDYLKLCDFWCRIDPKYYESGTFQLNILTAFTICFRPKKDLFFVIKEENKIIGEGHLRGWNEGYDISFFGMHAVGMVRFSLNI